MAANKTLRERIFLLIKRCIKWLFFLIIGYLAVLLVGLIPVNNDFEASENGIQIFIISNAVHADIILPIANSKMDWAEAFSDIEFEGDVLTTSHVAFGWGDRGFFLETETWDDFKLTTAANALLLPSRSCVHVSFTRPEYFAEATPITISQDQYERLVDFIDSTFKRDEGGNRIQIEGYAYSTTDAFFDSHGRYHLLNTCNSWVGRALKVAGVRVPWLSPMPKTPILYVEREQITD